MFTLWYSVLSWKEYREVILDKLSSKLSPTTNKSTLPQPPAPKAEPPKSIPPPPQTVPKPIPPPPPQVSKPVPPPPVPPKSPQPPKLDPPAKPPRSPSPHPLRTEAFEDIEYEEEEESEEEDEDSVTLPGKSNPVNDFINVEINQQRRDFVPQRYNEQLNKK